MKANRVEKKRKKKDTTGERKQAAEPKLNEPKWVLKKPIKSNHTKKPPKNQS